MATMPGPNGAETMRILGREETLRRLERAKTVVKRIVEEKARLKVGGEKEEHGTADAVAMAFMFAHEDAASAGIVDGQMEKVGGEDKVGECGEGDVDEYNAELEAVAYWRSREGWVGEQLEELARKDGERQRNVEEQERRNADEKVDNLGDGSDI